MYTAIINMYFKATVPERTLSHLVITVTSKIRIILIKAYTKSKYKKKPCCTPNYQGKRKADSQRQSRSAFTFYQDLSTLFFRIWLSIYDLDS